MKDFLLIANKNCITYKEFFPLLKERKVSMGVEMPKEYDMPDGTTKKFGNICWFTTLHTPDKRKLVLTKTYDPEKYPKYDNYDAINVDRVKDIPYDYDGVMGVPITILDHNLDNVEVLWTASGHAKNTMPKDIANSLSADFEMKSKGGTGNGYAILNGIQLYHRVLIRLTRRKITMKDFLLLSSINVITYKKFFPLLKEGKARGGYNFNKVVMFETPEGEQKKEHGICWFTTLPTSNKKKLILTKRYHHDEYPHYDNYNAIEVSKIKDIPYDYDCVMGVPITIFGYDLDNVEIVDKSTMSGMGANYWTFVDGKPHYSRVFTKKKIEIRGIWNDNRKEADFIVKGTPTYLDEKHKSFQGPVVDGKAKYSRVLIRMKRKK